MKKLFLALILAVGFLTADAQNYLVTATSSTGQAYSTYQAWGYDSINLASGSANTTVPSGCFNQFHYMSLSAAVKYTGTVTLPTNPVNGQTVDLFSNKAFYHKYTTSPACITVDTGGSQKSTLIYYTPYWRMVQ